MKISVVTVTRNSARQLDATLRSVFSQTGVDVESVVVDGDSTDDSLEVIIRYAKAYPRRIKWVSEPDDGIYDAINKGIAMATGDVIGLLHSGDRFPHERVLEFVGRSFREKAVSFVYGDVSFVDPDSRQAAGRVYRADRFRPSLLLCGFAPPHPSLYIRKRVVAEVGRYKADYSVAADFEYFVRLLLVHRKHGRYLPTNMVEMATGGKSQTWVSRLWYNNKERLRALRENGFKASPLRLIGRYFYL